MVHRMWKKGISKDSLLITHLDSLFLFTVSKNNVEKLFLDSGWMSYSESCTLLWDVLDCFLSCGPSDTLSSTSTLLAISNFFETSLSSKFNLKS